MECVQKFIQGHGGLKIAMKPSLMLIMFVVVPFLHGKESSGYIIKVINTHSSLQRWKFGATARFMTLAIIFSKQCKIYFLLAALVNNKIIIINLTSRVVFVNMHVNLYIKSEWAVRIIIKSYPNHTQRSITMLGSYSLSN